MPHYDSEQIKEMLERAEKEERSRATTELKLDSTNKATFPGFPYSLEATQDRLLVVIDVFKSGLECKNCGGTGKTSFRCVCEGHDRPGYKYSRAVLASFQDQMVSDARSMVKCSECQGDWESHHADMVCDACKGKGAILFIPDEAKKLPTTGVIVSVGPTVLDKKSYSLGKRVLFSPYSGHFIPTQAKVLLKVIDEAQVLLKVEGGEDLGSFEFILEEEQL